MVTAYAVVLSVHVFSLLLWVGSLISITRVLSSAAGEPEPVRAKLAATARRIYRVVSSPWMGFALLSGLAMIGMLKGQQFRFGWFHAKFTFALVMLGLHFALGARVRKAESEGLTDEAAGGVRPFQIGVLVVAFVTVFCAIGLKAILTR